MLLLGIEWDRFRGFYSFVLGIERNGLCGFGSWVEWDGFRGLPGYSGLLE